jgi:zinc finger protein 830
MRAQKLQDEKQTATEPTSKKRKASPDEEDEGTIHKRNKPTNGIPEGFFDAGREDRSPVIPHGGEMQIPSRPATPSKPTETPIPSKPEPQVDEDEWAAFENDIATAEAQSKADNDAVISAPAVSAAELAKKSAEEEYATKKDRQEAELQGEKEDAARKMEEELETMEGFEARVKKMREKREALRRKEGTKLETVAPVTVEIPEEEDDDDEDYDDGWDNFRMK